MKKLRSLVTLAIVATSLAVSPRVWAIKVYINPSDQIHNEVSGGGVESDYALPNANLMSQKLTAAGFATRVDQDFYNAPSNANSWGADIFVSVHSNAGGSPNVGHGTSALYVSNGGRTLSSAIVNAMLQRIPYATFGDGLFYRDDLHVLNATDMIASLAETVFHDCSVTSGIQGHPPSESAFLRSAEGREAISWGLAGGVCAYFGTSCSPSPPSKGFIKGVVFKAPDLANRIAGATVKLNTGASTAYDGGNSIWQFEVDPGTYAVEALAPGYITATKENVVVTAGQVTWASVGLAAEQTPEPPAGEGTITGTVYKSPNQSDRIANATVTLNTGQSVVYDGTTDWSFNVPPGRYSITASASGYQSATVDGVVAAAGEVVSKALALSVEGQVNGGCSGEESGFRHANSGSQTDFSLLILACAFVLVKMQRRSKRPNAKRAPKAMSTE